MLDDMEERFWEEDPADLPHPAHDPETFESSLDPFAEELPEVPPPLLQAQVDVIVLDPQHSRLEGLFSPPGRLSLPTNPADLFPPWALPVVAQPFADGSYWVLDGRKRLGLLRNLEYQEPLEAVLVPYGPEEVARHLLLKGGLRGPLELAHTARFLLDRGYAPDQLESILQDLGLVGVPTRRRIQPEVVAEVRSLYRDLIREVRGLLKAGDAPTLSLLLEELRNLLERIRAHTRG